MLDFRRVDCDELWGKIVGLMAWNLKEETCASKGNRNSKWFPQEREHGEIFEEKQKTK